MKKKDLQKLIECNSPLEEIMDCIAPEKMEEASGFRVGIRVGIMKGKAKGQKGMIEEIKKVYVVKTEKGKTVELVDGELFNAER